MSSIPLPPGVKFDLPVAEPEKSAEQISKEATFFILKKTLHKDHMASPIVLQFIDSYLHTLDVRQAALEAGLDYRDAKNLRNRPDIARAIDELTTLSVNKYGYSAEEVIEKVKNMLEVDPAVLEKADGTYHERLTDIPKESRMAIESMKVKNEYGIDANGMRTVVGKIIEVKFYSRKDAAKMLGPEKGVLKDTLDVKHEHKISIIDAMKSAEERVVNSAIEIQAKKVE